jgi:hypothetical protein
MASDSEVDEHSGHDTDDDFEFSDDDGETDVQHRMKDRAKKRKEVRVVMHEETLSYRGKYHLYRIENPFPIPGGQLTSEAEKTKQRTTLRER